ncbi:hypothetical protein EOL73_00910 [Candidatus Saccharibacteria bacterium]|nr:hypothetical protein [Candidatus Saccharibacteria bacterium]
MADRLERMLTSSVAFKPFFRKFFNRAQATEAYKIYTDSDERGVYLNFNLRTVQLAKDHYNIMVFRTTEPFTFSDSELELLKSKASEVPPGMAKAEAVWFRNMEQWVGPNRDFSQIQQALGNFEAGIWAFVAAYTDESFPLVIYAKKGDTVSLLPVSEKMIEKLGLNKPLVSVNEGLY